MRSLKNRCCFEVKSVVHWGQTITAKCLWILKKAKKVKIIFLVEPNCHVSRLSRCCCCLRWTSISDLQNFFCRRTKWKTETLYSLNISVLYFWMQMTKRLFLGMGMNISNFNRTLKLYFSSFVDIDWPSSDVPHVTFYL
jgi:hypothetical protein